MGKTLQEQLRELEALFVNLPKYDDVVEPQVRRWVVWQKRGNDYRKVCVMDTEGKAVGDVVSV